MNNTANKNTNAHYKEFYNDFGFAYEDKTNLFIPTWHKCTSKPIFYNIDSFTKNHNDKICSNCKQPVDEWKNMIYYRGRVEED